MAFLFDSERLAQLWRPGEEKKKFRDIGVEGEEEKTNKQII